MYAAQNSLEALKDLGGVEAKFVPLFVLGSFALQEEKGRGENKNTAGGEMLFNQWRFQEEKPQESSNSRCSARTIQKKVRIGKIIFFFMQLMEKN